MEIVILTVCAFIGFQFYAHGVRPIMSAIGDLMISPPELDEEELNESGMADRLVFAATLIGYVVLIALNL